MTFNPRTIALCITLFLLSAFVTYTLRTSSFHPSQKLLSTFRRTRFRSTQQPQIPAPKVAYATFLAGTPKVGTEVSEDESIDSQDGYFLGTRVLAYQLLHSPVIKSNHTRIPFLVLCTPDVSARKRARLKRDGATVILVEKLDSDWAVSAEPRWRDVLAKLRLFQLTEYSKILFLDADTLVTQPLDGVFYDEATLTQATGTNPAAIRDDEAPLPRTYMFATRPDTWGYDHTWPPDVDLTYLNCGFFVFEPSQVLFDYYMGLLNLPGRFDPGFPEQNLLNYAHRRDGNMPWKPLWYGWNVNWPTAKDWRGGARSFHAKYWDGDPSHDPVLKAIWKEQRAEMEGYYRGREELEK